METKKSYSLFLGTDIIYSYLSNQRLKSVLKSLRDELAEDLSDYYVMQTKIANGQETFAHVKTADKLGWDIKQAKPFDNISSLQNKIYDISGYYPKIKIKNDKMAKGGSLPHKTWGNPLLDVIFGCCVKAKAMAQGGSMAQRGLDAKYSPDSEYKYAVEHKYIIGFGQREDIVYFKSEKAAKQFVSDKPSLRTYIGKNTKEGSMATGGEIESITDIKNKITQLTQKKKALLKAMQQTQKFKPTPFERKQFNKVAAENRKVDTEIDSYIYSTKQVRSVLRELNIPAQKYHATAIRGFGSTTAGYEINRDYPDWVFMKGFKDKILTIVDKLKQKGINAVATESGDIGIKPNSELLQHKETELKKILT